MTYAWVTFSDLKTVRAHFQVRTLVDKGLNSKMLRESLNGLNAEV